jgi:hypothetical protein
VLTVLLIIVLLIAMGALSNADNPPDKALVSM